jgi:RNA polymerase sigma factor (sigma-70 family)
VITLSSGIAANTAGVDSWDSAYVRFWPSLSRALAAATGSYEGVDDALQDAFVAAMRRPLETYRSLDAWIFVVALNRLRRERRRTSVLRRLFGDRRSHTPELDAALVRIDTVRVLARLSERDRLMLIAKYYMGLTQDEIAKTLGLKRGAVGVAISRAAERFRALEARRHEDK